MSIRSPAESGAPEARHGLAAGGDPSRCRHALCNSRWSVLRKERSENPSTRTFFATAPRLRSRSMIPQQSAWRRRFWDIVASPAQRCCQRPRAYCRLPALADAAATFLDALRAYFIALRPNGLHSSGEADEASEAYALLCRRPGAARTAGRCCKEKKSGCA